MLYKEGHGFEFCTNVQMYASEAPIMDAKDCQKQKKVKTAQLILKM